VNAGSAAGNLSSMPSGSKAVRRLAQGLAWPENVRRGERRKTGAAPSGDMFLLNFARTASNSSGDKRRSVCVTLRANCHIQILIAEEQNRGTIAPAVSTTHHHGFFSRGSLSGLLRRVHRE
jgi:hypothetical protein